MPACKACGEWFAKTNPHEELCFKCEYALYRLSSYVARVTRCNDCAHYDLGVCLKIYSDGNAQKIRGNLVTPMIFAVTERERKTILDYLQWKQEMRNLQKYKYYDIIFI